MREELQWKAIEEGNSAIKWGGGWIQRLHQRTVGQEFLQTLCGLLLLRGRFVSVTGLISK
jgi:hypothetical protein